MPETFGPLPFKFQSPYGFQLCRDILVQRLPFCPHDYQIRGVACILDGRDLLAVSATGSGKTAYIYMTLHVMLAILEDATVCPSAKFPTNPALLVISPTTALEENHVNKMTSFGLKAKAVNSNTREEQQKLGKDIWDDVESGYSVIFVSPEMLTSTGFARLIESKVFQKRLFGFGVDEVHLLSSWGLHFRPAFKQIGFIRSRFRANVVLFAMTATLLHHGEHFSSITSILGLHEGQYLLQRRSNARPDVQLIFRTINATQNSERFPDLDWVLKAEGKTLIFCSTILYGFRLAVYFWRLDPRALLNKNIRLFNSLNSSHYNDATISLLEGSSSSLITIATDKLSVGVDIADFQTVIIIDPTDLNDLWQKAGRVGRDPRLVSYPRAVVYIPRETMKTYLSTDIGTPLALKKKGTGKKGAAMAAAANNEDAHNNLHQVVRGKCHVAEIDNLYANPPLSEDACSDSCITCTHQPATSTKCNCSACVPEPVITAAPINKPRKKLGKLGVRVTKVMRAAAKKVFAEFRLALFLAADDMQTGMMPLQSFFPEHTMDTILDQFATTLSKASLSAFHDSATNRICDNPVAISTIWPFLDENPILESSAINLLQLLWEIHAQFDIIREENANTRRENRRKKAAKKLKPFPMSDTELESLREVEIECDSSDSSEAPSDAEAEEATVPLPKFKLHINLQKKEISVTSSIV